MNEAQVVALELERVEPTVPALMDRDDVFYAKVEKRPVQIISSRDMRIPLELRPGGSSGHWDPDGGDMGRGDGSTFDKGVINTVHLIHRVEWTTKSTWSTENSKKAVLSAFRHNLAKGMDEFRRYMDSLCMTAGDGVLATIGTVANAGGVDTYTMNASGDGFGVRLLRFGQTINVYAANLLTNRTAGAEKTITFYDLANKQIKIPQVAGAIATDKVVAQGLSATPPVSLFGVPYHNNDASTGTWLGFDRALTPEVRASRVNANSGALTLPLPRLAINKVGDRVGMKYLKKCTACMHPAQVAAYEELGQLAIIINKEAKEEGLDLYFNDNMRMAGAPIMKSYSWDKTRIDFIDFNNWGRAEYHKAGFYTDPEGRKFFIIRGASGGVAAANIFYLVASWNLYASNPAALTYISTLAVPSGY